jgi:hypothetical protein
VQWPRGRGKIAPENSRNRWERKPPKTVQLTLDGFREALTLDETVHHAPCNDALEDMAQNVVLAEAMETVDRKRGVMRHLSSRSSLQNHR